MSFLLMIVACIHSATRIIVFSNIWMFADECLTPIFLFFMSPSQHDSSTALGCPVKRYSHPIKLFPL